ncbi:MAG TPA: polyphosphate polymerase domain-containing protein [Planctomycetota bacterium]|nr:polyphosphate polymerase domain-containing protein [Planctomycetota bacterium]
MPTRLDFLRFEFKYVLPADLRREVERELGYFMQLDPFVGGCADKKYFVRSLYFDSPGYEHYFEKIDGMLQRAKFRVRTYARSPGEAATFLELKGRHDALVFKHRAELRGATFARGSRDVAETVLACATEGPVLQRFRFERERRRLRPVMLIDYERRPYVSRYDHEFRLTFDDTLRATRTESLFPAPWENARDVLLGATIMEVKFRYHVPSWFHRILQSYDLRRQSISKVCEGMEVWQLHPDMEF